MRQIYIDEWTGTQTVELNIGSVERAFLRAGDVIADATIRVRETIVGNTFTINTDMINEWYGYDINYGYVKTLVIEVTNTSNSLAFTYSQASLLSAIQRQSMVSLDPTDVSKAYTLSYSTSVDIDYGDGLTGTGDLNIFYSVRERGDTKHATLIYNFECINGNACWMLSLPDILYEKRKTYQSLATYRDGIFTSTDFPRVTAAVLDDASETRLYIIRY